MAAAAPKALLWYAAATSSTSLRRPLLYVGAMFAKGLGVVAARAPVLAVVACLCAFAFTGWIPPFRVLALSGVFGLIAAALLTALDVVIGLLAFWLDDVTPVYWVWQKLLFVCGGLMMPIQLYPSVIQRVAAFTPFPSSALASFRSTASSPAGPKACN